MECFVCLELKECTTYPRCVHIICIDCFTRCFCGKPEPPFPYPELENEYFDDPNNSKWND